METDGFLSWARSNFEPIVTKTRCKIRNCWQRDPKPNRTAQGNSKQGDRSAQRESLSKRKGDLRPKKSKCEADWRNWKVKGHRGWKPVKIRWTLKEEFWVCG